LGGKNIPSISVSSETRLNLNVSHAFLDIGINALTSMLNDYQVLFFIHFFFLFSDSNSK